MDPTSLPTDNLYKFLALSGVALSGSCIWMRWKLEQLHTQSTTESLIEMERISATLKRHVEAIASVPSARKIDSLIKQMHEAIEEKNVEKGERLMKQSIGVDRLFEQHEEEMHQAAQEGAKALEDSSVAIAAAKRSAVVRKRERRVASWLVGGVVFGLFLSTAGFTLWYVQLQRHLDEQTIDARQEQEAKTQRAKLLLERAQAKKARADQ